MFNAFNINDYSKAADNFKEFLNKVKQSENVFSRGNGIPTLVYRCIAKLRDEIKAVLEESEEEK